MEEKVVLVKDVLPGSDLKVAVSTKKDRDFVVQNEISFINDMEYLYMLLRHPGLKGNVLSLEKCIQNVSNMLTAHRNLRDELSDKSCLVSCAFFNFMPHLKVYIDYAYCVERVNICVQKITTPCIGDLWKRSSELLSAPISHLAKYKEIISHLSQNLPDQDNKPLTSILEAIEKTVEQMHAICSASDNALKVLQIQKCLIGGQPKIFAPGRILLKEGCLLKVKPGSRSSRSRVFFLFSDILLCCKGCVDWRTKSSLICQFVIPIHQCTVHTVWQPQEGCKAGFEVRWDNNSCILFSKSEDVMQSWVNELQLAIKRCKELKTNQDKAKCSSLHRNTLLRKQTNSLLRRKPSDASKEHEVKKVEISKTNNTTTNTQPKLSKKLSLKQSFRALFLR